MKAVSIYYYGGPGVLAYEDAPRPHPAPGDVLVRVHAAGINPVDWKIREGHLKEMLHHTLPLVLGWDVSGVVAALGDGADAEFIVIRETEVALKPKSVDHVHAAALPLAGLTVWQSLFDAAALTAGQRVLIHAAAGGVGSLAVPLAKGRGAHVIGTASAKNHAFVRALGADEVVDYERERFETVIGPVDVVFDTMGGDIQTRSWKVLKRGGILVSIASPPSAEAAVAHGGRFAFVFTQPNAAQLAEIATLVDAGKLNAMVETVLPLAAAMRGQALSAAGHTRGKIVLQVVGEVGRGP